MPEGEQHQLESETAYWEGLKHLSQVTPSEPTLRRSEINLNFRSPVKKEKVQDETQP